MEMRGAARRHGGAAVGGGEGCSPPAARRGGGGVLRRGGAEVANHPAIKPANNIGDMIFIVLDSPGRGWIFAGAPFQRLGNLN